MRPDIRRGGVGSIFLRAAVLGIFLSVSVVGTAGVRCAECPRDSRGRIARSASEVRRFKRMTGYPHGRPGWVVDHVVPLKRGGCDCVSNMQWQTREDARRKDKWE